MFPGLVEVEQPRVGGPRGRRRLRRVAVALGVFDYVARAGRAAHPDGTGSHPHHGSFPSPGLRGLELRKVRYGMRGVGVHGYTPARFDQLASTSGLDVVELHPLGRAGYVVHFQRQEAALR